MQTFTITFCWTTIHGLFTRLDGLRWPLKLGTFDLHYDVFGGTYHGPSYERKGLPGLIELSGGLDRLSQEVWKKIHALNRQVQAGALTRELAIELARQLAAVAVAIAAAKLYMHEIGLRGDPTNEVCGTGNDTLTGLRWLVGFATDEGTSMADAHRFALEGPSALTAA